MTDAYVLGVGRTPYGRFPDRSVGSLAGEALALCLTDAGVEPGAIGGVFFANAAQGALEGQHLIRGQAALRAHGIEGVPVVNVENACASGGTALHLATTAVRAGELDIALALGAEKMYGADADRTREAFLGGMDVARWETELKALREAAGAEPAPEGRRSVFMDVYAALAAHYMRRHPGCTPRRLAAVTAKNRRHGSLNPRAAHRTPLTVDEVLDQPVIVAPLTRAMCATMGDGAAAALVCSPAAARRLGTRRAVRIRASVVASGTGRPLGDDTRQITRLASGAAYERAGLGPSDISLAEVHDATAIGEVLQVEALGLIGAGDGAAAAERGETALGGRLPVNTSGGLECNGHPVGATGIGQVHELVTQLRGEAGDRQVPGARIGLAENGGGFLGYEEAAAAVVVLEGMTR
ncbi:thiolase family protein [Streptomyces sp. AV19]|uniref:thiolase family protein n=1 Tax=Streptomyces sp. AV19 TaxID=2793068 RepID=UPI0018FED992|nr:thiolase family protein [Streptomyces sp. AV19]MBH1935435.1 thiolase family protein [Streptomyces sp. AV19]MDG4531321.1 thiolase family protein [Streptomyces sp. AV19]